MLHMRRALLPLAFVLACSEAEDPDPGPSGSQDMAQPGPDQGQPLPDQGPSDGGASDAGIIPDMLTEDMSADGGADLGPDAGPDGGPDMGEDMGPPPCSDLPAPGTVLHVDASAAPGGNGTSWATAFLSPQDALAVAIPGQEVWIAAGLYAPVLPADPMNVTSQERGRSFDLVGGVSLIGGFAGDELRACDRPSSGPDTILSGDLLGDDVDDDADGRSDQGTSENSRHVLRFLSGTQPAALVDLVIVGGLADGGQDDAYGGGLLCREAEILGQALVFRDNQSPGFFGGGAGMAAFGCQLTLEEVRFQDNVSGATGGGLWVDEASANVPSLLIGRSLIFEENLAVGAGGGAELRNGTSARLSNLRFEANEVTRSGGGTGSGGGLSVDGADVRLGLAEFKTNLAAVNGGGLNQRNGRFFGSHIAFDGNQAEGDGGGMAVASPGNSETSLQYVAFLENGARAGGALHARDPVRLGHGTVVGNTASSVGGAFHTFDGEGPIRIHNSIIWANSAVAGANAISGRGIVVARSILQDSAGGSPWVGHVNGRGRDGGGVLDFAPAFLNDGMPRGVDGRLGTADDGLQLVPGAPGIDLAPSDDVYDGDLDGVRREPPADIGDLDEDGDFNEALTIDLAGGPRLVAGASDMGAYEEQTSVASGRTLHVDADASGAEDGSSWTDAFTELRDALAMAQAGDEVWVADGTYRPGTDRSSSFVLVPGVPVLGGFNGTETMASQRNPAVNTAILSGEIGAAGPSDNARHVVTGSGVGGAAPMAGFTIESGNDDLSGAAGIGGGILVVTGSPRFQDLIIRSNQAGQGGGLYASEAADVSLRSVVFRENGAQSQGGGIFVVDDARAEVVQSVLSDNEAPIGGGAIFGDRRARVLVSHSFFVDNSAIGSPSSPGPCGGALQITGAGEAVVLDSVFVANEAALGGGLCAFSGATLRVADSTLTANVAAIGGAFSVWNTSEAFVSNSIAWDNALNMERANPRGPEIALSTSAGGGGALTWQGGILAGGGAGPESSECAQCTLTVSGVVDLDPLFSSPAVPAGTDGLFGTLDDGLVPAAGSPAIDAGTRNDEADVDGDLDLTEAVPDLADIDQDGDRDEAIPVDAALRARSQGPQSDVGAYEATP